MDRNLKGKFAIKSSRLIALLIGVLLVFGSHLSFAAIILHGNQVINAPRTYTNQVLDLTDGRFTIQTGGILTIQNSTIDITISPTNPFLVQMNDGSLILKNNIVNVKVSGISQIPSMRALYQLIAIQRGSLILEKNNVMIDTAFTVGFLDTLGSVATTGFKISGNTINNFHGGIYLNNSNDADVKENTFSNVSFSNIYNSGNLSNFNDNTFNFPGNLQFGNAIDIVNSDSITISNNVIASGSNDGISVMGANNLFIENNKITDNKAYGIIIYTPTMSEVKKNKYLSQLIPMNKMRLIPNTNIVISNNYISQNKYGLTGGVIERLIVTNNFFIQHFTDTSIRQYWTNNDNLLPFVSNLTWVDNIYKEAFTQENGGDNTQALQFVTFPQSGGVFIN